MDPFVATAGGSAHLTVLIAAVVGVAVEPTGHLVFEGQFAVAVVFAVVDDIVAVATGNPFVQ